MIHKHGRTGYPLATDAGEVSERWYAIATAAQADLAGVTLGLADRMAALHAHHTAALRRRQRVLAMRMAGPPCYGPHPGHRVNAG